MIVVVEWVMFRRPDKTRTVKQGMMQQLSSFRGQLLDPAPAANSTP